MTRCKFKLNSKNEILDGSNQTVYALEFSAVISGSPENKSFFRWTPNGNLKLGVVNPAIGESFEVGSEYYIDIIPVPANNKE